MTSSTTEMSGFKPFAQHFFAGAAPEDLDRFPVAAREAIARLFWTEAARRPKGTPFVRVFTPEAGRDGFTVAHSLLVTINDDKPFLVDSILSALGDFGVRISAVFHPIFRCTVDAGGARRYVDDGQPGAAESFICVAFSRGVLPAQPADIEASVSKVLADVGHVVSDWRAMLVRLDESIDALTRNRPRIAPEAFEETLAFLRWLKSDHFTFLGCRDYVYSPADGGRLTAEAGSGLGLLRDPARREVARGADDGALTDELRAYLGEPSPLLVTKSLERSPVHRRVPEDFIGIKRFDASGALAGERRFIGLFTSAAYNDSPRDIPFLRRKVANVRARSGFIPGSHNAKALAVVLETFPRDELFQISEDDLLRIGPALAYLGDRPDTRVFVRFDTFNRFASVLVYFPADKFRGGLMRTIGQILTESLGGEVASAFPHTEEGQMTRVHYTIMFPDNAHRTIDAAVLEGRVARAVRLWTDHFADELAARLPADRVDAAYARFAPAFPESYRVAYSPAEAINDIDKIDAVLAAGPGALALRTAPGESDSDGTIQFKIYHAGGVIELSTLMPVLEDFGLRAISQVNYTMACDGRQVTIHDLTLHGRLNPESPEIFTRFEAAFLTVWRGGAESDGFNRLVLVAGLTWREVAVIRMMARYLRQAAAPFSQSLIEDALARNPRIAAAIAQLFVTRFRPGVADRPAEEARLSAEIDQALARVPSLDDDRIIRRLRNVVQSSLRTNYFQTGADGAAKAAIAIKLDSQRIEDLPLPRPRYEIFVCGPEVEGVHLRFGRVARGGIRWSDRRDDFRTEVLGLVKAQQVKNAVIVPVGSKGGFYPKKLPSSSNREAWMAAGVAAYKVFISSLLDLTDNIGADGAIVPPANVVRHDGDDAYLVVAADKGTATFSDIANGISEAYGFWLGDAFASGGSAGYDHKKMGITARGAWETVKRHFREMGNDIQSKPFTVVGVGDMSGDVFGNGMLLSPATRLVAAFDHRDIFLDPDPDPVVSLAERQRLFDLPRSSWADYEQTKISRGGGVYSRAMKRIPLSPEVRALTGLEGDSAEPTELIRALLRAPVDLLWFGGIGTYVKASFQTHAEVGDKACDALRVDARDVRAKVIGEGANLGMTQAGRIEYAQKGGRLNTDAIDNSAGVDTSDHEVNLKILLGASIRAGELKAGDRDALLARMTDEVAQQVLADNYNQSLTLSVAQAGGAREADAQGRFMKALEREGRLNRAVEGLPSGEALHERANRGEGLTRPELAVLLAYAKLQLFDEINASALADEPHFERVFRGYFPSEASAGLPKGLAAHRLRREIVATVVANDMINRGGPVFVHRLKEASAAESPALARAYTVALETFAVPRLAQRINALDNRVPAAVQNAMHGHVANHLMRQTLWFTRHLPKSMGIGPAIETYLAGVEALRGTFSTLVSRPEGKAIEGQIATLQAAGVPFDLAEDIAVLPAMGATPDIVRLAAETSRNLDVVAGAHFAAARIIGVDRLRLAAERMTLAEHWDRLAVRRLVDDLSAHQRALAARALAAANGGQDRAAGVAAVEAWAQSNRENVERVSDLVSDLERSGTFTVSRLTLAAGQIRDLLQAV